MNINFKEVTTGEDWEFFARDFLSEVGFCDRNAARQRC